MYTVQHVPRQVEKSEKETIHSGHFMVSHFEAEEQDDEDNVAVPIPETTDIKTIVVPLPVVVRPKSEHVCDEKQRQQLAIDTSLAKLFQCMSLAYRQKLTSPKWNRFRGIRLRWKDKIRLNNVIWRCWHLQFIKKERTLVCQFASPLDVDTHNKPEAVVLEGKYWKRKLAAVTAEYKRWRMFYRNNILGHVAKDTSDTLSEMDLLVWENSSDNMNMMVDEDYMGLMSDTLFSTITNQAYAFPDSREIAKAGLADFIQPSLGPLQPNLDDYMDTFDPLQELICSRLPTVQEENHSQTSQTVGWGYLENSLPGQNDSVEVTSNPTSPQLAQYHLPQQLQPLIDQKTLNQNCSQQQNLTGISSTFNNMSVDQYISPPPSYQSVIKNEGKTMKGAQSRGKVAYSKSMENVYQAYTQQNVQATSQVVDRMLQETSQVSQQLPVSEMVQFKLVQMPQQDLRQGYKFSMPSAPSIKFTTSQVQHPQMMQNYPSNSHFSSPPLTPKEEKSDARRRGAPRGRGRSRSNTREPMKRPPLLTAVSDSSLLTSHTSVLLTQLLTNNTNESNALYNRNISQNTQDMISNQVRVKEETALSIMPQNSTTLIIPAPVSINAVQPSTSDPLMLNTFSNSNSPITDPLGQSIHSPTSSQGSIDSPTADTSSHRDRRVGHIHAEQKRRYNIKNGFDMIHSLIPHLNQNPNAKLSKAAMLQKGAEYIRQLKAERNQLKDEMELLRQQTESLNTSISNCQSMLPATGAPVSRRRDSKMRDMFDDYVRNRTMENWKFWIFSLIFRPLLISFNNFVSTSSLDDLYSSTMLWIEQHCTLVDLRPVVLNSLKCLCTKTEILADPEKLPEEAREIALGSTSSDHHQNQ